MIADGPRETTRQRPTPSQERAERMRLYGLGKPELMKRVLRFDGRLWNELVIFSTEYFVDRLIGQWKDSGWRKPPSGQSYPKLDFAAVRSALYQLPHGAGSLAVEAEAALDAIERDFLGVIEP